MGAAGANKGRQGTPLVGWVAWGVVSLFYLYEFLVRVAPSVMEPDLQKSFHLNAAGLGAVLGAYYYIYAPLQVAVGGFLDEWGTRRVLVPSVLLCAAGTFLEIAPGGSAGILLAARLMQGAGSAFAFVGAMHAAAQWFPPERMALISGLTTALGMIGAIIGNAAVAQFVADFGWQASLRDAGIFGIFVAIAILVCLPRPKKGGVKKKKTGNPLPRIFGYFKVVMANPQTWIVGFVAGCLYLPLSVFGGLWGVPYIGAVTGESVVSSSKTISAVYIGWLVGGPLSGWLSDHFGRRKTMLFGATVLTLLTTVFLSFRPPTSIEGMFVLLLLVGLASSTQVVGFVAGLEANPRPAAATSIAAINMIVMLLGGLLQPVTGYLLDLSAGSVSAAEAGEFSAGSFRFAMLLLPLMSAVAVVACLFLRETYGRHFAGEEDLVRGLVEE